MKRLLSLAALCLGSGGALQRLRTRRMGRVQDMKLLLLLAASVLSVSAASYEDIIQQEWQLYKAEFGKSYDTPVEDYIRMKIFRDNRHAIATHNLRYHAGEESYEMGVNRFSDMLPEEVDEIYNGYNKENRMRAKKGEIPELPELDGEEFVLEPDFRAPDTVDWVKAGAVTEVRDQGKCGSCYSFAAVGALEGHHFIKTRKLVSLSMQNILDCSGPFGNKGCNGGLASISFNYVASNNGINDYNTYPYEAKVGRCRFNPKKVAATCVSYTQVPLGNEEMLKNAVAKGPVAVSIDASLRTMQQYKSGIYSDPKCSSSRLGHAVLVVGYGTDPTTKKDYWLVKNSWGAAWGDKGYFKLARNARNMCGVATRAVYPKV